MYLRGKNLFCLMLVAVMSMVGMAATIADAEAKSRTCRKLETQLAAASGGSSSKAKRYDRAIAKQKKELGVVRARLSKMRCGFAIFGDNARQCAQLNRSAARMTQNIAELRRQRGWKGGGSPGQRSRIRAALKANNCDAKTASRPREVKKAANSGTTSSRKLRRPGTVFQTMCVRTCDGYYFPISFSVSKDKFSRDAETCTARCPGAEVALYAHDVLNEEAENMISVADGTPYRELPKAFSYRENGVSKAACGCRKDRNFTIVAGQRAVELQGFARGEPWQEPEMKEEFPASEAASAKETSFYIAKAPERKPVDSAGDASALQQGPNPARSLDDEAEQRRVRIVGPAFLPDPKAAIDLRAPAPAPAP
ncbi:DUF2865 domain-containing protein [uncultured Nitratireductor sp.]|uniref:DUF2865 domain-containing protein n=1 Tax=uncultured Nitratireductor sp. TaxID=520953 RepID=UPI00260BD7D1|nr:DUF2865 domain-containing protein [uncultured Nitratireductor sp.]